MSAENQRGSLLFLDYAKDEVICQIDLEPKRYEMVKKAAREAHCSVATFIKRGFLQVFTALEKEIARDPHSVRKGRATR